MIFTGLSSSPIYYVPILVCIFYGFNFFAGSSPEISRGANGSEQQSQLGSDLSVAVLVYWFSAMIHIIAENQCKRLQASDPFERRLWSGLIIHCIILLAVGYLHQSWILVCRLCVQHGCITANTGQQALDRSNIRNSTAPSRADFGRKSFLINSSTIELIRSANRLNLAERTGDSNQHLDYLAAVFIGV